MPKFAIAITVILVFSLLGIEGETVGFAGEESVTLTDTNASVGGDYSVESVGEFDIHVYGDGNSEIANDGTVVLPSTNMSRLVITTKSDTLNKIAKNNPIDGLTVQQVMLALLQANPQAFINKNINLVKEGVVLRIPHASEIVVYSQSQTVAELAYQERLWREYLDDVRNRKTPNSSDTKKIQLVQEQLDSIELQTAEQKSRNRVLRSNIENLESQVILQNTEAANLERQLVKLRRSMTPQLDVSAIGEGDVLGHVGPVSVQNNDATSKLSLINALSFALVASLLVMSPGPNGVLIAKTVPTSGKAAGFANVAGFVAAFNFHGTLSILGISAILLASPQAFFIVKILGAIYLCWVGFKALRDAYLGNNKTHAVEPAIRQRTLRLAFVEGLLTNALNPKTSMFYLAAFPQFIPAGSNAAASAFTLVFLHTIINVIWFGAMVLLLARFSKVGHNASFQRWLQGFTGIVFVGFGIKLATYRA